MSKSIRLALYLATRARGEDRSRAGEAAEAPSAAPVGLPVGAPVRRRPGPCVWFHVGRDASAVAPRELGRRMAQEREDLTVLITSASGAAPPADLEDFVAWQPAPHEGLLAVRRFLDHWVPDIAVWTEIDLRPALISEAADRAVPLFMVNIAGSPGETGNHWVRSMAPELLGRFRRLLSGDAQGKARLLQLGADARRIEVTGYLQEGSAALPCSAAERDALTDLIGARPSWAAIEVAPSECALVVNAHLKAQRRAHRLLLILVPEDPALGPAWAGQLRSEGHAVALRSEGEEPDAHVQIYIADVPGELGLWYRLAPISFLGQSYSSGQIVNPFDAAALGSAIVHGPRVDRHQGAIEKLTQAQATRLAKSATELGTAIDALLSPAVVAELARRAWDVSSSGAEVTDRLIDLVLSAIEA